MAALPHHHHHSGSRFSAIWDKLGIVASGLCLIDCIVLPLVSTALISFQSSFVWAREIHWALLPMIALTASFAFYHSYRAHRSYRIVAAGAVGFLLLLGGEIFEGYLVFARFNFVSVLGSVFLIGAHLANLKMHWKHRGVCRIDHGHGDHGKSVFGRRSPEKTVVATGDRATLVQKYYEHKSLAFVTQEQSAQVP